MTIASTTSKVSYNGSGSTGPFPITFKFTKNADIVATKRSSAGVETTLALTTDYTLTGAGDASGGTLTLVTALAVGESLVIARSPGIVQEVDYVENSAFPAETHEGALDLLTMICQSLQEQINRSVKVEISSTTSPDDLLSEIAIDVAGAAAAVDAAETAQGLAEDARDAAISAAASVPTFGAFGLTLAATTTASNARTALELGTAALANTGTGPGNLLQLNASGQIPAVPGDLITGLTASQISGLSSGMPTGAVVAVASSTVPSGFLECNGAAVSRTTYADLFAAIGVVHGYGDNSTTFNLPDYRGRFLRGWDHAIARDPDRAARTAMATGGATGDAVGSVQVDAFKSHTHGLNISASSGGSPPSPPVSGQSNTALLSTSSAGGNETRPINANVMYCIKY